MLIETNHDKPKIGHDVYIAPNATVVGNVQIGDESSIWFQTVIRGDVAPIKIGKFCNIQDLCMLHGTFKKCGVTLGDRVSVGHKTVLHGCEIGEGALVGMSCTIMDEVKIGKFCLIGAGSLVTEGTVIPDGHLAFGAPAKVVRPLTSQEQEQVTLTSDNYLMYKKWYKQSGEEHGR